MRPSFKHCRLLGLLLCAAAPAAGAQETAQIFAEHKDQVLQVRMLDRASGSKASIGSGFLVSADGHIITNFHVIAQLIYKAQQYRAEYVFEDGRHGELELRAIDVVHDLALLQADAPTPEFLTVENTEPRKGERLYAFGNPHDLGLTIVEGTYNGLLEKSIYEKIHFTGSINPGMSGGPAVNAEGRVVGVNVATAGNQVSFLVPARYVSELIARAEHPVTKQGDFTAIARDQLLGNQSKYMQQLLSRPLARVKMNGFVVPGDLARFLNCWGDTQKRDDVLYEWAYQSCSTSDDIFLSDNQSSGVISFSHELFSTHDLGPIRFFGFLQNRFRAHRPRLDAEEEMVTNYDCESGFVEHNRLQTKVIFCLRAYKKFDGLFDAFMKSTALTRNDEALQSTLTLAGVSYENAVRLARTFLEAIEWKN